MVFSMTNILQSISAITELLMPAFMKQLIARSRYGSNLTNPIMHLSHIPQYTIQNRNVQISDPNGVLLNMG